MTLIMLYLGTSENSRMTMSTLNAKSFIIDLLLASGNQTLSIKQLVNAAQILQISENNTRVAVTRLCSEKMIESVSRGFYKLSSNAEHWGSIIIHREHALKNKETWNQHYLAIFTPHLGRTDRTALSRREKLLKHAGFRELETGFFIRPDNLTLNLEALSKKMTQQGLDADARWMQITQFDPMTHDKISTLWDTQKLNQRYEKYSLKLKQWLAHYQDMQPIDLARESFLLGRETIALMLTDPLLPAPFIDTALRTEFFNAVQQLDQIGQHTWQQLNHDEF